MLGLEKRNGVKFFSGPATVTDDDPGKNHCPNPRMRRSGSKTNRKPGDDSRLHPRGTGSAIRRNIDVLNVIAGIDGWISE